MLRFRLSVLLLCLIWLIPGYVLLTRVSSTGTEILGRYTFRYLVFLVAYGLVEIGLVALAVLARPRLRDLVLRPVRWLQKRTWLLLVVLYGLIEFWYLVRRVLDETRFFGIRDDFIIILVFLALLELYVACVLVFAGREPDSLRTVLTRTGILAAAGALIFVVFSLVYAFVINAPVYSGNHAIWWDLHQPDPLLGYSLRPNLDDFQFPFLNEDGYPVSITTDAEGFRNTGDTTDAPVAVLGDSIIFGQGVPDGEIWSTVLGQELGISVANYGVMGYSLEQYTVVADRYLPSANHRVVIYGIFADDMGGGSMSGQDVRLIQRWTTWPYRSPFSFTLKFAFGESPASQVIEVIRSLSSSPAESTAQQAELPYDLSPTCVLRAYSPPNTEGIARHLDRAIQLANESGYTLLVVTIPTRETIYSEYLTPVCASPVGQSIAHEREGYAFICDYLEARGVRCYDMTLDMHSAAAEASGLLYGRGDDHLSPRGQQVFAGLLRDYLVEHRLLSEPVSE